VIVTLLESLNGVIFGFIIDQFFQVLSVSPQKTHLILYRRLPTSFYIDPIFGYIIND